MNPSLINEDRLACILRSLVRQESENPPGNEANTAQFIEAFLLDLGLPVWRQMVHAPDRFNILSRLEGEDPSLLPYLFNGHMDVVPAGDLNHWHYPPFEGVIASAEAKAGGPPEKAIFGRGSSDMKGSIACALYLCELLVKQGIRPRRPLLFLFNVDEEHGATGMEYFTTHEPPQIEAAIVGEPTAGELHLCHRGRMAFTLTFRGKSCHASMPEEGVNAVYLAQSFIHRVRLFHDETLQHRSDPRLGHPSMVVTTIRGGFKSNVIPDQCIVEVDRRMIPGETPQEVLKEVEKLALEGVMDALGSRVDRRQALQLVDIQIQGNYPPGAVEETDSFVTHCRAAYARALGREPLTGVFPATCEAGMLQLASRAPVVILGAGDLKRAHQPDEFILVRELVETLKVYLEVFHVGS